MILSVLNGKRRNAHRIWGRRILLGNVHLEDLEGNGKITLRWLLRK
jgi:hypothetical protein